MAERAAPACTPQTVPRTEIYMSMHRIFIIPSAVLILTAPMPLPKSKCDATGAEDQVSVNQEVERSKMERDYQAQMRALSEELNRVRQELTSRTEIMGQEMERWRQTAEATSRYIQTCCILS